MKIKHPDSEETISGDILQPGTILEENDYFPSTSGHWEKCPCPGSKVPEGNHVIWVRESKMKTLIKSVLKKNISTDDDSDHCGVHCFD